MVEVASLRLMRDKKIITQEEYDSALKDIGASIGTQAEDAPNLVVGKWSAALYGFIEGDVMLDSTQSFNDVAGNAQVQRQNGNFPPPPALRTTYAGDHGRLQFSVRNSRFGLRLRAPELGKVRASATLEMDFLGVDPSIDPSTNATSGATTYPLASGSSEASFWNNPTVRMRLAYLKVETPVIDVVFGQYWHLFGWQPIFHPNSVQIQGLPGELYQRTLQLRLSKEIPLGPTSLELAVSASRPPQRNSMIPEFTGGIRFSVDKWTGMTTRGSTARAIQPLSIAVTGTMRNFVAPSFEQLPTSTVSLTTAAVSVVAFVPVVPATKGHEGNSLSLTGQLVMGGGISDLFTSLTGGIAFASVPNKTGLNPAPTYPQDIENGLVAFDTCSAGNDPNSSCRDLHPIQWNVFMGGLQYYLPGLKGRMWVAGNYAHIDSPNIANYTRAAATPTNPNDYNYVSAASVRQSEDFFNACLFVDPLPSVRIGAEYAHYDDKYVDGVHAIHHRGQLSGFFLF